MAKKISYRAVPIERLTSALLAAMLVGASKLIVAIDVAKLKMMAGFGSEDGSVVRLVRFESPMQTREFVELVVATGQALGVPVEALMEPTGTYGEVMKTGHVGAEYVEHTMRFKRRLTPAAPPLRLGDPVLDALAVREPDLAVYDDICAGRTKDPGEPLDADHEDGGTTT